MAYSSLLPIFPFNAPDFPKAKMRTRFMILCQPSLNGLPFIFSPPLLYKPPLSFISKKTSKGKELYLHAISIRWRRRLLVEVLRVEEKKS